MSLALTPCDGRGVHVTRGRRAPTTSARRAGRRVVRGRRSRRHAPRGSDHRQRASMRALARTASTGAAARSARRWGRERWGAGAVATAAPGAPASGGGTSGCGGADGLGRSRRAGGARSGTGVGSSIGRASVWLNALQRRSGPGWFASSAKAVGVRCSRDPNSVRLPWEPRLSPRPLGTIRQHLPLHSGADGRADAARITTPSTNGCSWALPFGRDPSFFFPSDGVGVDHARKVCDGVPGEGRVPRVRAHSTASTTASGAARPSVSVDASCAAAASRPKRSRTSPTVTISRPRTSQHLAPTCVASPGIAG